MSIVMIDGFDMDVDGNDLARRGWQTSSANLGSPSTGRFTGSKTMRLGNGNNVPVVWPITAVDTLAFGFAYKGDNLSSYGSGGELARFRNGNTDIIVLGITSTGALKVGRGNLGTQICISAGGVMLNNTWEYVEIEITRHASAGSVYVYCNGVLVASATGVNTGSSSIDGVGVNGGYTNQDFDDMYIANVATRVGECRVETLRPEADVSVQFTPNSGANNYSRVNTTTLDGDTTYNASSTVGHKDLFDLPSLSATPAVVYAVKTTLNARKDDAATRTVRTNLKSGSTTVNGTSFNVTSTYTMVADIYENNPDDAAPFDGSDVNAIQLGYEVVA